MTELAGPTTPPVSPRPQPRLGSSNWRNHGGHPARLTTAEEPTGTDRAVSERVVKRDCDDCETTIHYTGRGRPTRYCRPAWRQRAWALCQAEPAVGTTGDTRPQVIRDVLERVIERKRRVLVPAPHPRRPRSGRRGGWRRSGSSPTPPDPFARERRHPRRLHVALAPGWPPARRRAPRRCGPRHCDHRRFEPMTELTEATTPPGSPRPRRQRATGNGPEQGEHLARLTASRDRLDAAQTERRRREDTALGQYAAAAGEADAVIARRDAALAELDRRSTAVHDQAAAELAVLAERQSGVLAELAELGRRAEDLAALFDLPVKRVRALLQQHRAPADSSSGRTPAVDPLATASEAARELPTPSTSPPPALAVPDPGGPGVADQ